MYIYLLVEFILIWMLNEVVLGRMDFSAVLAVFLVIVDIAMVVMVCLWLGSGLVRYVWITVLTGFVDILKSFVSLHSTTETAIGAKNSCRLVYSSPESFSCQLLD